MMWSTRGITAVFVLTLVLGHFLVFACAHGPDPIAGSLLLNPFPAGDAPFL